MPRSGFGLEGLLEAQEEDAALLGLIEKRARAALDNDLFLEWLDSFIIAYNTIRYSNPRGSKTVAAEQASHAGIIEWDLYNF